MFGEKTRQAPAGYASMKKLLAPLRLYDLDGDSLVSRELKSYAAGLELFRERLAAVWRDLYPDLCSAEELARWERRLDLPVERAEEEDRRAMAMQRLSICDGDFTREGIERSLASAGLLGQAVWPVRYRSRSAAVRWQVPSSRWPPTSVSSLLLS